MATITEDYVSFKIAKLLKDKGFGIKEETCGYYPIKGDATGKLMFGSEYHHNTSQVQIAAPTLQMAMKWLRKIHHIHIRLINSSDESYRYEIYPREGKYRSSCFSDRRYYETYEEAAEAACIYALKYLI